MEDNSIKELKDGHVSLRMKLEGMQACGRFEEVGKRTVAFVVD